MSLSAYDNWKLDSPPEYKPTAEYYARKEEIEDEIEGEMEDAKIFPTLHDAVRVGITPAVFKALWRATIERITEETLKQEFNLC